MAETVQVAFSDVSRLGEMFEQMYNQLGAMCGYEVDNGDGTTRTQEGTIQRIEAALKRAYIAKLVAAGQPVPEPLAVTLPGLRDLRDALDLARVDCEGYMISMGSLKVPIPLNISTGDVITVGEATAKGR